MTDETPVEATARVQREVLQEAEAERTQAIVRAEDHRSALEYDYGQWVAVIDIPFGTAIAYAKGHPVPDSNVKQYGYDKLGYVKRVDS